MSSLLKNDVWINVWILGKEEKFFMSLSSTAAFVLYRCLSYFKVKECRYFALFFLGNGTESLFEKDAPVFEGNSKLKSLLKTSDRKVPIRLRLEVMCHPMCVSKLTDLNAVKLLFYSVKRDVVSEKLPCSAEDIVYLTACSLQAKFGDYDADYRWKYTKELTSGQLVPRQRMKCLFGHTDSIWIERTLAWYKEFRGWTILKAQLKYLKRAQTLGQYGVHFFEALNRAKSKVYLGIEVRGLKVYARENKNLARASVAWDVISALQINKNKFIVKCAKQVQLPQADSVFMFENYKTAKKVLQYAMLHHYFYLLFHHASDLDRNGSHLARRMDQLGVAGTSPTRRGGTLYGCDTIRSVISSSDSFYSAKSASVKLPRSVSMSHVRSRRDKEVFVSGRNSVGTLPRVKKGMLGAVVEDDDGCVSKENMNSFLDECLMQLELTSPQKRELLDANGNLLEVSDRECSPYAGLQASCEYMSPVSSMRVKGGSCHVYTSPNNRRKPLSVVQFNLNGPGDLIVEQEIRKTEAQMEMAQSSRDRSRRVAPPKPSRFESSGNLLDHVGLCQQLASREASYANIAEIVNRGHEGENDESFVHVDITSQAKKRAKSAKPTLTKRALYSSKENVEVKATAVSRSETVVGRPLKGVTRRAEFDSKSVSSKEETKEVLSSVVGNAEGNSLDRILGSKSPVQEKLQIKQSIPRGNVHSRVRLFEDLEGGSFISCSLLYGN